MNSFFSFKKVSFTAFALLVIVFAIVFVPPADVNAHSCDGVPHPPHDPTADPQMNNPPCHTLSGYGVSGGGATERETIQSSFQNPLSVDSIEELLVALLGVVQVLAIPIVVFFIIYAGFLYVTARGNAEQVKKATNALLFAVIGGVLIVGAAVLAEVVKNVVTSF